MVECGEELQSFFSDSFDAAENNEGPWNRSLIVYCARVGD